MSCSDCISHSEEAKRFVETCQSNARGNSLPIQASLELTLRCNVRCKHCYILYPGATNNEMSTSEVKHILDKLERDGVLFLTLTGGEPLSRPDFKEIYLYAKQRGFVLSLYTNATLVTEEIADFLTQWPPSKVEVTIYGHSEETYERVTGVRGSFHRFRKGVKRLKRRGVKVALKTIIR